ncbi:MAG: hypothetical protein DRN25_05530 [Thermoplasmata archaeon]|nr:MAG: hypothetical protein DRN25_05530 [Thermoplasmata archaeon]
MLNVSLQSISLKSPRIDFERGLSTIKMFDWMPDYVMDSIELLDSTKANIPVDGSEIVEWMQYCTADNAIAEAYEEEYNRFSNVRATSGDGYVPGVYCSGIRCKGNYGRTVRSRGYAVVYTPRGSFNVPLHGKAVFCRNDVLAWAALPAAWYVQIRTILQRWVDLAKTPIDKRIRFPSYSGLVSPNFFTVATRLPSPVCLMKINITSDKAQVIQIKGRGTKGSYHNILFEDSFEVEPGENEIIYNVMSLPFVPQFTLELQPENQTKTVLDSLISVP